MELSYWRSRWRKNKTGFHMPEGYPGLEAHWHRLQPENITSVLVPLCGKSVDLVWLSQHADSVIGVEIAEEAITGFMKEQGRSWTEQTSGKFTIYDSGNIKIWCGDFMTLRHRQLPSLDLIYDKAALTALPPVMRRRYAGKICDLSNSNTQYLLHHFIYNQEEMNGPPFSISHKEISKYFKNVFAIEELSTEKLDPKKFPKFVKRGLKSTITERFLLLKPKKSI
ncbi:MAG: thiopurine S-methyltransferase [Balneolaceae bacterium]